ncbi:MAG: hypothetical protein RMJ86_10795, partial [Anaerolineae bacterium]|nr:hypothetical protein [Anaerolineae bacterium]
LSERRVHLHHGDGDFTHGSRRAIVAGQKVSASRQKGKGVGVQLSVSHALPFEDLSYYSAPHRILNPDGAEFDAHDFHVAPAVIVVANVVATCVADHSEALNRTRAHLDHVCFTVSADPELRACSG